MAVNWATGSLGATIVDCSSELESNEACNILDPRPAKLWLSSDGLPQWLSISLTGLKDIDKRSVCIRTIGWRCWHAYRTNPRKVTLHVSADGAKFRLWDKFIVPRPASGTHLFCCAPISIAIYPYIALEITHTFGGSQTYMNRVYLYTDEIPASPLSGSSKLDSVSTSTLDGQSDIDGDDDDDANANTNADDISIINIPESVTKEIQIATETNEDASFSLIDNLTSALEITREDEKGIEKKGFAVEQIDSNPLNIPITPATNMNFLDTSTSASLPVVHTYNHGLDRPTSPSNTNSKTHKATSSPKKKMTDQSTSPRRINSNDPFYNYNHDIDDNDNYNKNTTSLDRSASSLKNHKRSNQEKDDDDANDSRIHFLEDKISKLEALISSSSEISNTMKIAKEKTKRICRHLNKGQLRKGFADDSSQSSYDSDDELENSNNNKLNNFKSKEIPREKISSIGSNNKAIDIVEGIDTKLSSLYDQVIQNDKNMQFIPSLSHLNKIEEFNIDKLRRQYLSQNEIETLLNPLKTPPCLEIPSDILYGVITDQSDAQLEHQLEHPQIPTSTSQSSPSINNPKTIESELNERSEASFQAISELVKALHMKVQKKIIKETQLKLLKKKLTIK